MGSTFGASVCLFSFAAFIACASTAEPVAESRPVTATTASPAQKSPAQKSPAQKSPASKSTAASAAPRLKTSDGSRGPEIRSGAIVVMDESDSSILLSKNADVAVPIASITKVMTAMVVLDAGLPLDDLITLTRADLKIPGGGPSRLPAGAKLTRGELIHLSLMSSENHAAHALGRTYPGGMTAILDAMNAKAKSLGMKRTRFADTTGLSAGNIASPEDLSRLVVAAAQDELIEKYSTDPEETFMVGSTPVEYRNTNYLVTKPDWDIRLQKTGYTQAAGRCLVMKTFIDDRPIVMVLMNSFGKYTRTADAIRVRRWMESIVAQPAKLARN